MTGGTAVWPAIGARIRELRTEVGLTQAQLAQRIDVSRISVVQMESGIQHTTVERLLRIADVLGVSVSVLLPQAKGNLKDDAVEQRLRQRLRDLEHRINRIRKIVDE